MWCAMCSLTPYKSLLFWPPRPTASGDTEVAAVPVCVYIGGALPCHARGKGEGFLLPKAQKGFAWHRKGGGVRPCPAPTLHRDGLQGPWQGLGMVAVNS